MGVGGVWGIGRVWVIGGGGLKFKYKSLWKRIGTKIFSQRTLPTPIQPCVKYDNTLLNTIWKINYLIEKGCLKVPSLARSVPKPLMGEAGGPQPVYTSLFQSPLKVPSLARSVPKPRVREAGGYQPGRYEPLSIFAVDLLIPWSSAARYEYRLPKVN